jgi:tetratricopeptide (TPR) repeat protein
VALSERALELAQARGPEELVPPATAMLSAALASRGEPGDIDRAMELGDKALETWIPGTRPHELAEALHLHGDAYYWTGDYGTAAALSRRSREAAGMRPTSQEFLLRGVGLEGLALTGLGRYEEAIKVGDGAIAIAEELGQVPMVVKNYSTLPLREIFDFEESRKRSREVMEAIGGPQAFNMPWMNACADLLQATLLAGHLAEAEPSWPEVWEEAQRSKAWEHWLISGRLAALRADMELRLGRHDDAITWAGRALEMATSRSRKKYAAAARTTLGLALVASGRADAALEPLRNAMESADSLGNPLQRWQTRAALASAYDGSTSSGDRDAMLSEAVDIIRGVVASLSTERAATYAAAEPVVEVLDRAGVRLEAG